MGSDQSYLSKPPASFICPLTQQILKDPVIATDGHTYEREAITKYLMSKEQSPLTGEKLSSTQLTDNIALKNAILAYNQVVHNQNGQQDSESLDKPSLISGNNDLVQAHINDLEQKVKFLEKQNNLQGFGYLTPSSLDQSLKNIANDVMSLKDCRMQEFTTKINKAVEDLNNIRNKIPPPSIQKNELQQEKKPQAKSSDENSTYQKFIEEQKYDYKPIAEPQPDPVFDSSISLSTFPELNYNVQNSIAELGTFVYDQEDLEGDSRIMEPRLLDIQSKEVYSGQWKDGLQHGRGQQAWGNGAYCEGYWKKGKFVHGRLFHANGNPFKWNNWKNRWESLLQ